MYCRDTREEKRKKKGKLIGHVDEGGGGGGRSKGPTLNSSSFADSSVAHKLVKPCGAAAVRASVTAAVL